MIALLQRVRAAWDLYRRTQRVRRRFRRLGPLGQAQLVITAIERDPELRQRFRQAIGINMAGRPRRGKVTVP